jgi:NitT/TauT family transport system ATP-binding protein
MRIEEHAMSFLDIANASFTYPGWPPVVRGVDWDIAEGEFHCLVGRSGCGKTTLLKLAAGLIRPDTGRILLQGRELLAPGPQLGFVFQSPTLLEWHRVIDNVLLPVSLQHKQSRVALARALILEPALLLLDEPFAALDAITRGELQDDLLQMCKLRRTTVMFVTHDIAEAVYLGDRVAVMDGGRIVRDIRIDVPRPRAPAMRYSAQFNSHCAQVREAMDRVAA